MVVEAWQWLEQPNLLLVLELAWLDNKTGAHIFLCIIMHLGPIVTLPKVCLKVHKEVSSNHQPVERRCNCSLALATCYP